MRAMMALSTGMEWQTPRNTASTVHWWGESPSGAAKAMAA